MANLATVKYRISQGLNYAFRSLSQIDFAMETVRVESRKPITGTSASTNGLFDFMTIAKYNATAT